MKRFFQIAGLILLYAFTGAVWLSMYEPSVSPPDLLCLQR